MGMALYSNRFRVGQIRRMQAGRMARLSAGTSSKSLVHRRFQGLWFYFKFLVFISRSYFKVCRYLETLVRSRFFVQNPPPGRPQRPSETFLASDEVGGRRQLDPDEIRYVKDAVLRHLQYNNGIYWSQSLGGQQSLGGVEGCTGLKV